MLFGVDRDVLLSKLQTMQDWLLIAYAISLPLTMTGSWGLLTAGLIVWAVQSAIRLLLQREHDHGGILPPPLPLKWPLVAVAFAVALSGFMNPGPPGALSEAWRCVWSLKAIMVYFWASTVFHYRPWIAKWAVQSVLCVAAVAGIWGTIQQVFDFHPFGYHYLQGTGFLSGPMPFAGQMQIFGMLSLGLLLTGAYKQLSWKLSNKYFFAAITAANLLGLVFAGERSAWLAGLTAIMVMAALVSWKLFFRSALCLLVIVSLSWYTVPLIHTRLESVFTGQQDVGTRVRIVIWKKAIDLWQSSPIFGIGFMSFPRLDIPEAIVPGVSKDLNHAHSNYLQFLSTTGVVGTAAYAWLCIAILMSGTKAYIRARRTKDELATGFTVGTLAAMVSLMVSGLFELNFGTAQVRLVQWFVLGLLAYTTLTELPKDRGSTQSGTLPDSLPSI